jgi:hypothetical protein
MYITRLSLHLPFRPADRWSQIRSSWKKHQELIYVNKDMRLGYIKIFIWFANENKSLGSRSDYFRTFLRS